jgi:hypothetical protein
MNIHGTKILGTRHKCCAGRLREGVTDKTRGTADHPAPRVAPQALFAEVLGSPLDPPSRNFRYLSKPHLSSKTLGLCGFRGLLG